MLELGSVVNFIELDRASARLEILRRLGVTRVQPFRHHDTPHAAETMRGVIESAGMRCDSLHAVFDQGPRHDPAHPDESARKAAAGTIADEARLCRDLGGQYVIVHGSTAFVADVDGDMDARRTSLLRSMHELAETVEPMGIRLLLENLPPGHVLGPNLGELGGLIDQVGSAVWGLCLDTGHANMSGNPREQVLAAGGRLASLHFHDNAGEADTHMLPGEGTLDVDGVCAALAEIGYAGPMLLELNLTNDQLARHADNGAAERIDRWRTLAAGR